MSITYSRGDGYQTEVQLGGLCIGILVHINERGCFAIVTDKILKKPVGQQEVEDFEDGKRYAVSMAASYLRRFTRERFPAVEWKPTSYLRNKLELLTT
jgi:hypothetical protein